MTVRELSENIVSEIIKDLSDRRELRHEWDKIDDDIKRQIRAVWKLIVVHEINRGVGW